MIMTLKYLFVLDRPLEESFAGLTCEQAVVVARHLEGQKSESDPNITMKVKEMIGIIYIIYYCERWKWTVNGEYKETGGDQKWI